MAGAATATYSADVWTSASTLEGNQQQWEYSVPVNQETNRRRSKSRTSRKSRDRGSKGSRSSSLSKNAYIHDHASRGRRDASLTRRESESGAGDAYTNGSTRKSDVVGPNEQNDENWIHRDKLAKIESEELHQAAILFHRRPGTGSTRAARGRSRDQQHGSVSGTTVAEQPTEPLEPWPDLQEGQRNNAVRSTHNNDGEYEDRKNWDLRRPEEIAADSDASASYFYRNPGRSKSSSRIPIPLTSPTPLSPDQTDREYFTPRSRAASDEQDNSPSWEMPRRVSEPLTVDSFSNSSPPSESRPGSRGVTSQTTAAKKTPAKNGPANRKTSATTQKKTTPRSRATSSNNNQRPTTRSGEPRPPTAVNRPEGDPPWLATMYKPDPRLPPDQQMLPTHARKMQQEQWAKEGKTPTTYDREFAPLAIAPDPPRPEDKVEKKTVKEPEPEVPPKTEGLGLLPKSPEPGTRPGTSTGYSPMPKVQDTPPTGLTPRFNSSTVVTAQGPSPDEEGKVEKGCGCCIVM
ncbi:uncharacterized protein BDV14DRAFT_60060 [Aspergillus stella-maris]|uniref:uncharacterized protein n=1 Tax=Aspergillus stella-maris TaxID=1810926 RepID=UPI003CCD9E78